MPPRLAAFCHHDRHRHGHPCCSWCCSWLSLSSFSSLSSLRLDCSSVVICDFVALMVAVSVIVLRSIKLPASPPSSPGCPCCPCLLRYRLLLQDMQITRCDCTISVWFPCAHAIFQQISSPREQEAPSTRTRRHATGSTVIKFGLTHQAGCIFIRPARFS